MSRGSERVLVYFSPTVNSSAHSSFSAGCPPCPSRSSHGEISPFGELPAELPALPQAEGFQVQDPETWHLNPGLLVMETNPFQRSNLKLEQLSLKTKHCKTSRVPGRRALRLNPDGSGQSETL